MESESVNYLKKNRRFFYRVAGGILLAVIFFSSLKDAQSRLTSERRKQASSVVRQGNFNGWGQDHSVRNAGTEIGRSPIWLLEQTFAIDAQLDYKIMPNG